MTRTGRPFGRRYFVRGVIGAATVAAFPAVRSLHRLQAQGRAPAPKGGGYGPLLPTADLRDGVMRIALPKGFQYRSFSHAGELMSDGKLVPLGHDGMAAFNMPDGKFRLVRNHEDRNGPGAGSIAIDENAYDPRGGGGTVTLVINPFTRQLERDFVSLSGTTVNCAGGATPWTSWISCEESNGGTALGWTKQHGYCFEVPASANATVPAVAIPDMGRFAHEAVAVDPSTSIVYETEDSAPNSGFYRFLPSKRGALSSGGRLQMLAIVGQSNCDLRRDQNVGLPLPATWVDIANPNPSDPSATAVFSQGAALGGASFARLEGCWWGNGAVYFSATNGGNAARGQIWEFRPRDNAGTLTLIFESTSAVELDGPDNITVSPQKALLLCEDGQGDQYLRGLTLDGGIFDFALNLETSHEWAGVTFAVADPAWNEPQIRGSNPPLSELSDRITLFVNRQGAATGANPPTLENKGITFAIWGPWERGAL
jgi:secreted PhoX family phosphatase